MNIIESILIEGLWGPATPNIRFKLDKHFNFLIGQNGTGKTTVINLIAAALAADFERLDKIQFSRIVVTLKKRKSNKKPSVEIIKKQKEDLPYFDIEYRIKESANDNPKIFDLDALAEEKYYRGMPPRALRDRFYREKFLDIQHQLRSMVNLCWLSVNRHNEDQRSIDDKKFMPSVDQKLSSLNTAFLKYFSQLSRNYAEEAREFQKKSFLSLLTAEGETALLGFSRTMDIESEKRDLSNVFNILGVESNKYSSRLDTHFSKFDEARKKWLESNALNTVSFAAIYNASKTHALVQHYHQLEKNKKEIFQHRDKFFSILNDLFDGRKIISISERSELIVHTKDGKQIPLEELSSGEKQLIIILGEAYCKKVNLLYILQMNQNFHYT